MTATTDGVRLPKASFRMEGGKYLSRWHWVVALIAYTVLSVMSTFPLILHLGDSVAGPAADGDNLWFAWLLWAYRGSVLSGHDPNRTHLIFSLLPSVSVLADAHFNLLVGIPLQWIMTPLAAYNLLILVSFILSGLMAYLLAREFVPDRFACFVTGFLYTFSTYHFARAAGHFGLLTLQWLPFCAWRLFALYRRPSRTNAILAGVSIAFVPFSDVYYLAYFLVPFVLLLVVSVLLVNRQWFGNMRHLGLSALTLVIAGAIMLPVLAGLLFLDKDETAITQAYARGAIEPLAADLVTFVVPSSANPLVGPHTQSVYNTVKTLYQPIETSSFLGYPLLFFALCALWFRLKGTRTKWFWLALGIGGMVLALGPALFVAGRRVMSLPTYGLLYGWSLLSSYRAPNRLVVLPLLAFAVLSAFGVEALRLRFGATRQQRYTLNVVVVVLLAVALAQQVLWSFPYPDTRLTMSPLYQEIAMDQADGLLLDLPLQFSGAYQYDQSIHHKRLVFGYTPRVTSDMLASVYNQPYLSQFVPVGSQLNIPGDRVEVSPEGSFRDVMQANAITYVVMHQSVEPISYAKMRTFLIEQLGMPFYDNAMEGLTAWKVPPAPPALPGVYRVTFGARWLPGAGQRDGIPERDADQDAQVTVVAPTTQTATLSFRGTPVLKPMQIEVRVNGHVVKTISFDVVGVSQGVKIEQVPLTTGQNTIELHAVGGCVRPSDISNSPDIRCFTIGVQQLSVTAA